MNLSLQKEIRWLLEDKYHGEESEGFYKDIKRLQKGEPLDYVIGFIPFLGCHIDLSEKPFIPRTETEYWTARVIEELKLIVGPLRCLDIFAGSGAVGVALLKHLPSARVDFAEKDSKFLKQIKINLEKNNLPARRYRLIQSDVFLNISGRYDYIFANPPYLAKSQKDKVEEAVVYWEPAEAIWGGEDGLYYIEKLLKEAADHLSPGGKIFFEFDDPQKTKIQKIASGYNLKINFFKDQFDRWRYAEVEVIRKA